MDLSKLPYPPIIEELSFKEILNSVKSLFKERLNADQIELLESDEFSAVLETLAYREMLLRARINASIKACLLPYACGADLDNVVAIYGIERLKGEYPRANVEFSLSIARGTDITVPAGTVLNDGDSNKAILAKSVVLKAGGLKANGEIVLQTYTKTSDKKCEYIETPLPYVLKAKQITSFSGGADPESDKAFRARAVLSLDRFSTAGAAKAYKFHSFSASAKVYDASIANGGAGVVNIYLQSDDDSDIASEISSYINADERRPLTDNVVVTMAKNIKVLITADVELTDMLNQNLVDESIKNGINRLKIGEDLNLSYIYSRLHQAGVYRATIKELVVNDIKQTLISDVLAGTDSFVSFEFELTYKEAIL
ncbi:baseplate assembly protein [Campylobacter fetus subsp. testudinum]|nr:baseplate assembly protein [Campylobacter fetus subsp. testudinum]